MAIQYIIASPLNFFGTILIANYFGTELFGKYRFLLSIISPIAVVLNLGLNSIVVRDLVVNKNEKIIEQSIILRLFFGFLFFIAFNISLFLIDSNYFFLGGLLSLSFIFSPFLSIISFFEAKLKNNINSLGAILKSIFSISFKFIIIYFEFNLEVLAFSYSIDILFLSLFLIKQYNFKKIQLNTKSINNSLKLLKRSIFLIPQRFIFVLLSSVDQYFLMIYFNSKEVGIYSIYYSLFLVFYQIISIISIVLFPSMYTKKINSQNIILSYCLSFYGSLSLVMVFNFFGIPILYFLLDSEYLVNITSLRILTSSIIFASISLISGKYILLIDKNHILLKRTIIALVINILLDLVLIKYFGIMGASLSTFIAFFYLGIISLIGKDLKVNFKYIWKGLNILKNLQYVRAVSK